MSNFQSNLLNKFIEPNSDLWAFCCHFWLFEPIEKILKKLEIELNGLNLANSNSNYTQNPNNSQNNSKTKLEINFFESLKNEKIQEASSQITTLIENVGNKIKTGQILNQNHLFGIPQGAQFEDLRIQSAKMTMELDFAGYSIGGVANGGEPEEIMYRQVLSQTEILENRKPRHLLGVGTPKDIVQMVARGIDMFDCVYPTRNARHGSLFIPIDENTYTTIHITNVKFTKDWNPINVNSVFPELCTYSKGYLCHLFRVKELLGMRLATLNNLEFYASLMYTIRAKINDGTFDNWWQNYKEIKV